MVYLSSTHDRINISLLCDKMMKTGLTGQVIALKEFMGRNAFVCITYGGQLSVKGMLRMECNREVSHLKYYLIAT